MSTNNIIDLSIIAKLKQFEFFPKKVYDGIRLPSSYLVRINGVPLDPRSDLKKTSNGFTWGEDTLESRQLAFAILVDLFGSDKEELIQSCFEIVMHDIICELSQSNWILTDASILSILVKGLGIKV